MNEMNERHSVGIAAKIGATLFVLWGVLHIWVGYEGVHQYLTNGTQSLWNLVIGGSKAPRAVFVHAADPVTAYAHGQLLLNFCIDVGGYGVLGLVVAWMIWSRASWVGYFIGLFIIGIADLTFLFALVTSGVIEFSIPTISGPIIWFLALAITPFGMPRLVKKKVSA
jgi:uncharacterized membrane protein (Fun14 family)